MLYPDEYKSTHVIEVSSKVTDYLYHTFLTGDRRVSSVVLSIVWDSGQDVVSELLQSGTKFGLFRGSESFISSFSTMLVAASQPGSNISLLQPDGKLVGCKGVCTDLDDGEEEEEDDGVATRVQQQELELEEDEPTSGEQGEAASAAAFTEALEDADNSETRSTANA